MDLTHDKINSVVFNNSRRIPEIYGMFIALGMLLLFLIFKLTGLVHMTSLRLLNIVILAAGVYYALKQFKRTHSGKITYFKAWVVGMSSAFIGISTFVLVLFIYIKLNPHFMDMIKAREPMGEYLNAYVATFAVWVEGIFAGLFVTFLLANGIETKP